DTVDARNTLALVYQNQGKNDQAVPLYQDVIKRFEPRLGADHPHTLVALVNLGVAYRDLGRLDDAIRCMKDALNRAGKRPGGLPATLPTLPSLLAEVHEMAGQLARAEPLHRAALEQARKQLGPDDLRTAGAMASLGLNLLRQEKHADAEKLLRDC